MAEEHDSWIATLGVNISASTTPTLKDSDFPTDARARKAADQEALKTGQERRAAMNQEKGDGPPEEEESALGALVDKAKKKAEEVWDDVKIPKFGGDAEEKPEDATPLVQFLQDLEDGIEEAQKYIKFIDQHRERLDYVAKAAEQLDKINGQIKNSLDKVSKGLGKVSEVVNKAKKMLKWADALRNFAAASRQMKATDRGSVKSWVTSLEKLWNASADFSSELKSQWWEAVLEGSELAFAAPPLIAAGATLYVGIQTLQKGVENVDAYFARLEQEMKEIDRDGPPREDTEALPDYPGEWKSRQEREQWDDAVKKASKEMAGRNAQERARQDATERFNEHEFLKGYKLYRPTLRKKILEDFKKSGNSTWSDLLTQTGEDYFDDKLGIQVYLTAESVTNEDQLKEEFDNLRDAATKGKPCTHFKKFYDAALKQYLDKSLAAKK